MRLGGYRFCMPARLGFELAGCLLRDPYAHVCVLGGGMSGVHRLGSKCSPNVGWGKFVSGCMQVLVGSDSRPDSAGLGL